MPFAPHLRITVSGLLGAAGNPAFEEFSYRLNYAGDGYRLRYSPQAAADFAADTAAFMTRVQSRFSTQVLATELKVAPIGPDGLYEDGPIIAPMNTRGAGGGPSTSPSQVALAVSLTTPLRGPSGKGRFFLPMPFLSIGPDGLVAEANVQAVAVSAQTYLNDLNNGVGLDLTAARVVVASTKGFNSPVTGVRVGRALDTIRSRRQALLEAYGATLPVS
jgi:hypothetical protein